MRQLGFLAAAAALMAGCQQERYRSMNLGAVEYNAAYQTAVQTLRDYYPLESADASTGHIVGRMRPAKGDQLAITHAPARERAEMRIRREKQDVWADIRIRVERQESDRFAHFPAMNTQNEGPTPTPAEEDAPFTREQQEVWTTTGTNWRLEREILNDLYLRLHPRRIDD